MGGLSRATPKDVSAELRRAVERLGVLKAASVQDTTKDKERMVRLAQELAQLEVIREQTTGQATLPELINQNAAAIVALEKAKAIKVHDVAPLVANGAAMDAEIAKLRSAKADWQEQVIRHQKSIDALVAAVCCPTCQAKAKGWKANAVESIETLQAQCSENVDKVDQRLAAMELEYVGVLKQRKELLAENEEREEMIECCQDKVDALTASIKTITDRNIQFERLRTEHDEIAAKLRTATGADNSAEITELAVRVAVLEKDHAAWLDWQRDIGRRDELEQAVLTKNCEADVLKAVVEIVATVQADAAEKAFGEVLAVSRRFTDGILKSPLEYREGTFGRRVVLADVEEGCTAPVGSWVSHTGFSGTEKILAYAGLSVALATKTPIRLVIMDELGRVSPAKLPLLVERMVELVRDGVIEQFIGIDASDRAFYTRPEIKLISL